MSNPRATGLAFLLIGVLTLVGNTLDVLPAEAFFAGLIAYPIGGYLFFVGSRRAIQRAEVRTLRSMRPKLKNERGTQFADQQASKVVNSQQARAATGGGISEGELAMAQRNVRAPATLATAQQAEVDLATEELTLYEVDTGRDAADEDPNGDFGVTSDVSFPLEIQEETSIAAQIEKLRRLQDDGIITSEEFAIAKAKLFA